MFEHKRRSMMKTARHTTRRGAGLGVGRTVRTQTLHNTATTRREIQPPQTAPEILRCDQPGAKFTPAKRA